MNLTLLILFQNNFLLAWEAALRKMKVKLELLTNINMLLMVKKGIKGGVCHFIYWYPKANSKWMEDYNPKKNRQILCNTEKHGGEQK